ncbi:unnamed protein product [Gongylonema pulchrum]|uniref:Uncharacterized protein n=1 Tax=Gongylonema pulchrum TaxID=637853 RepID=A0A183EPH9_9BILA|nr:unnamed protein product [Gongylonema pulchrum]
MKRLSMQLRKSLDLKEMKSRLTLFVNFSDY